MEIAADLIQRLLHALLQLAAQPFYYIGILFVVMQYRRQIALERQLFSTKLHSLLETTWHTVWTGLVAGLIVSVVMAFVGATVPFGAILWLWAVTVLLAVIRIRFVCMAYSVGILGMLHAVIQWFPDVLAWPVAGQLLQPLEQLPLASMLALVGLLHLLEAWFVRRQGAAMALPMFVAGKRGKVIGGYHLQQVWPVPLLLMAPGQSGTALPWKPLFGADAWSAGWTLIPMPVLLGFAEQTTTMLPAHKARRSGTLLATYAVLLLGFAALAQWVPAVGWIGALVSILFHEAIIWWSRSDEATRAPLFVHTEQGLRILAVLPKSPAAEMGLLAGETIHRVNGIAVHSKEQFHQALRANAAFCKLEVINLDGHSKFVQRALFAGDHHLLGAVLAPDEKVTYVLEQRSVSWLRRSSGRQQHAAASHASASVVPAAQQTTS